jgi:putative transposase
MRLAGIKAQTGYKKKPGSYGGSPAVVADSTLNKEFDVMLPTNFGARPCSPLVQEQWSSDITYIRTHEGFLHLAAVIDLFSRCVIDWSMQGPSYTDLPLKVLLPLTV